MEEKYEHALYKHCDEKEADALAWAFVNKEKMVLFPFKFPPLAKDEIRANILYAGLCHSDVLTVRSEWGPAKYPIAPGHEIIAEVSMVGEDVKDFKKGDLVAFGTLRDCCDECVNCKAGRENICLKPGLDSGTYGKHWGGYATQLQQPAKFFFHLPEKFDIARGAPLLCAGITTYYPMEKFLKPDMTCGVIGIGGLGHMALQFCHKLGHKTTAFTTSEKKADLIKKLGADNIVISTDKEQMKKAKNSCEFVINTLAVSKGFDDYLGCTERGGVFVQVGAPSITDPMTFNAFSIIPKEISVVGSCVGPREPTKKMLNLCVEKDIYPMVEEFSFMDFPKAFDKLENGRPLFRCVVNVKDFAEKNGWKK